MTHLTYARAATLLSTALAALVPLACSDDGTADPTATTGSPPATSSTSATSTDADPPTTTDDPTTAATTSSATTSSSTSTSSSDPSTSDTEATTGDPPLWQPPACDSVIGTGAVSFSHDEGATLAPMDQQIVPVTYTFGLVALSEPGFLLASSKAEILASTDAGCTWHSIGPASGPNSSSLRLQAAGDVRAYGWGDNDIALLRVDGEAITALKAPFAYPDGVVGLGVDPADPDHVRIGDTAGRLWDSTDAGATFDPIGVAAIPGDLLAYRAAFDPAALDHVLFGTLVDGVLVSDDGGANWTPAAGLGPGDANGFNLVVSPADGAVVWVEGLDLEDPNDATARHIWRSTDGGLGFTAVVDSDDATLYNGNHLFAHPTDPDVLYFVFGSNFGNYGTDLFRYDHADGTITTTHNKWHDTVIAFMPGDPTWLWLGLSIEPGGG